MIRIGHSAPSYMPASPTIASFLIVKLCFAAVWLLFPSGLCGQTLEQKLLQADPADLFTSAQRSGNAARGAILFHSPLLGCAKCHSVRDSSPDLLGPNLLVRKPHEPAEAIVQSILRPSAQVADGYQSVRVLTADGKVLTGMLVGGQAQALNNDAAAPIVLRNLDNLQDTSIPRDEMEEVQVSQNSVMPEGLTRALANEAEFLDLVKYVIEIRDGGDKRARELQPTSAQLAVKLPDYEATIDHAGMIRDWDEATLQRGQEIYTGLCVNCHGTLTAPGSLATALRFGDGQFKHGSDPYAMYQTLTRGAGLMLPQPWMVPQQKYDVIHYIREAFLKKHNPTQYLEPNDAYLSSLPEGTDRGPAPQKIEPWSQADYGPRLVNTYELGSGGRNIAHKGIAIQLDQSPGGIAQGQAWAVFDHDTMRLAGVWTSRGFIDWQGIHFNGRHGIHPHIVGDLLLTNPTGPGWAHPDTGSLEDSERVLGRDGKYYGPLPNDWAKYDGIFQSGRRSVIAYHVGETSIREAYEWNDLSSFDNAPASGMFRRHLEIGPRVQPLELVVASLDDEDETWTIDDSHAFSGATPENTSRNANQFDGNRYVEVENIQDLNMFSSDFSIVASVKLSNDGTIFARVPKTGPWAAGGQTLFVRNGKLSYDVGWVGVLQSKTVVADGQPHELGLTFRQSSGLTTLWVDGQQVAKKKLHPNAELKNAVIRFGKTSDNFPAPSTLQSGTIDTIRFFARELRPQELRQPTTVNDSSATWVLNAADGSGHIADTSGNSHHGHFVQSARSNSGRLLAGWDSQTKGLQWNAHGPQLTLKIPAGNQRLDLTVWSTRVNDEDQLATMENRVNSALLKPETNWTDTKPTTPLFPETMVTEFVAGTDQGGFAVDVLQIPTINPWQARVRPSGLDFFADRDRMAVCTWDGDVWTVSGLAAFSPQQNVPSSQESNENVGKLTWRRIASGLFQPLGLKILDEQIYLTCRDQLLRLDDRNGDGEIDYFHCVNNDHQVTEHFHEFAMGLQTDASGNFYYAKSARHALPALVPHHGTLLRVSPNGSHTEIIANGFRAANGVCLNQDGTFIVTDQEGHWNPKNRINWVHEGGFYGNMYGYHDVTDNSDSAMEQPLCWITNKFDRSPSELLWVDSPAWGPFHGQLLNFSYGYGKIYVVPHESIAGQMQGGMCQLPIEDLPTGTMRARFSPFDGQLYVCGLSAWGTNQMMQEGGLYRIRYTGQPAALPVSLSAHSDNLQVEFSEPLGPNTSLAPTSYAVEVWGLKRSKNYGSDHYDQHPLEIKSVTLSPDRKTLTLQIPDTAPTWGMEIRLSILTADGKRVERVIHNTIYNLNPPSENSPQ